MSAPGLIWSPGVSNVAVLLRSQLVQIYGSILGRVWIADDVSVDGSSSVTTLAPRIGTGILTANVSGLTVGRVGRRKVIRQPGSADRYLAATAAVKVSIVVVGSYEASFPMPSFATLGGDSATNFIRGVGPGGNQLNADGTMYVDGVASTTVTSGVHVFECERGSASGGNRIVFLSEPTIGSRAWVGFFGCAYELTATQSSAQRTASVALLRAEYPSS